MLMTGIYRCESQPTSLTHAGCHCLPQVVPQQKVSLSSSTQVKPGQARTARCQTGLCTYLQVVQVLDLLMHKLSPGSDMPAAKAEPSLLAKFNLEAAIFEVLSSLISSLKQD